MDPSVRAFLVAGLSKGRRELEGAAGSHSKALGASESLREPLGAFGSLREPSGVSGSLREPLGPSGEPSGASGSLWEPLGASGSLRESVYVAFNTKFNIARRRAVHHRLRVFPNLLRIIGSEHHGSLELH